MVVILDVDQFLTKNQIMLLNKSEVLWPWDVTHFILSKKCIGCGHPTYSINYKPNHFIVDEKDHVKYLLSEDLFWCKKCHIYSVYDHYPSDECDFCF